MSDRFAVFTHLNAEKAPLYRALLDVFVAERARFTIALRPPEIAAALAVRHAADAASPAAPSGDELTAALQQLVAWKNLLAERDLADALQPTADDFAAAAGAWRTRWEGLRRWFDRAEGVSQAELLRSRARAAIPALLTAIAQLNERRHRRADRAADFLALGRWFAETPSDADAHRLWRAAFGLSSARHLRVDEATLVARESAGETARTSWLAATPLRIAPRLRKTGFFTARGGPRTVIDRSEEKALLAALTREEASQIARAREQLARDEPLRLAALSGLDRAAFDLFLDLLGEALARKGNSDEIVEAFSSDGQLRIVLEPIHGAPPATLETTHGTFSGPDHVVTIARARGSRADARITTRGEPLLPVSP